MKKFKKVLSTVLALSMLPMTGIMHASADYAFSLAENKYTATGWSCTYANPDNMGEYVDYNYGEPTKAEHNSGDYSWHIQNAQSTSVSDTYTSSHVGKTGNLPAGSYYISFMKKGYSDWTEFHLAWNAMKPVTGNSADWTKQEFILTTAAETSWIAFTTDRNTDLYIDDIEIYAVEKVNAEEDLSLTNYKKVGADYVVNGGLEDSGEKLTNNDNRQYYMFSKWSDYFGNSTEAPDAENYIRPTTKYARTGDYGVYVKSTVLDNSNNKYVFVETPYSVSIPAGTYNLEVWVKTNFGYDLTGKMVSFCFEGKQDAGKLSTFTKGETDENGWTLYTKELTFDADASKKFWLYVGTIGEFAFDDAALYRKDDESKTNLFVDGSFEDVIKLPEGKYTAANWEQYFAGKANIPERRTNFIYTEPTTTEKYSGNYSMHISYPYGTREEISNRYLMPIQWNCNMPAGTYYVTYMKKGTNNSSYFTTSHRGTAQMTTPGTGNGETDWVKVENIITQSANSSWVSFLTERWSDLYIDDVEVYAVEEVEEAGDFAVNGKNYKKTNETNYIKNGGFETVTENKVGDINLSATPVKTANALDVAWVNPGKNNITDISVYADGKKVSASVNLLANASNSVIVKNLTSGKATAIKVVLTDLNGETYSYETTGTPDDLGDKVSYGSWKYTRFDGTHGDAVIDTNEFDSGKASLRMDINLPDVTSNTYVRVDSNEFELTGGETYKLEFRYKAENVKKFSVAFDGPADSKEDWVYKTLHWGDTKNTSTDGWVYGTVDYTPTDFEEESFNTKVVFCLDAGNGSVWVDDVKIYSPPLTTTGDDDYVDLELIEDSGFEFENLVISEPSYNLVAEDGTTTPITAIQKGKIEVTSKIKNNYEGDSFNAVMIAAVYKGNALVDVATMEKAVAKKSVAYPADEFSATVNVPDDTGYTIKTMWWNGFDYATPIKTNATF